MTDYNEEQPFSQLRDSGLLWLINATVFHPRGFALSLHVNDENECTGWSLMGEGREPWRFELDDETWENLFHKAKEALTCWP